MARPDWLILPLALLPVAAAGALCLWARSAYRAQVAPYRADGSARAAAWLDGLDDGGAALRQGFVAEFGEALALPPAGWIDHRFAIRGDSDVHVRERDDGSPSTHWVLHPEFPGGISVTALADPQVRLLIQSGRSPLELDGVDGRTQRFAELLLRRDLGALRTARLPASTKAFIVRRWLAETPDDADLRRSLALLQRMTPLERLAAGPASSAVPGIRDVGDQSLVQFGSDRPRLLLPHGRGLEGERSYTLTRSATPDARLVWRLAHAPPAAEIVWQGPLETPLVGTWSLVLPHADRWWESTAFARWSPAGAAVLLLLLLVPAALLISLRRQRRLDEVRARFINELAHDLRTPLTSLRLYAEMLAGDRVRPEDRDRYSEVLARESARLSAVLANLLDLSRLEGGRRPFEPEDLRVADAARDAMKDFRALYPARAEDVVAEGAEDAVVRADRAALARCLGNLLDNAGKFTPAGSSIRVSWTPGDDGVVRLVVADEGPGIADAERERVFDRYARGEQAQRDGIPGTGLGLSLVRELARGMGGTAALREPPRGGSGLVLEVCLPRGGSEGGSGA